MTIIQIVFCAVIATRKTARALKWSDSELKRFLDLWTMNYKGLIRDYEKPE